MNVIKRDNQNAFIFLYWKLGNWSKDRLIRGDKSHRNQNAFIPFVFDAFGCFTPNVVNILKRVKRVMYNNVLSAHRSLDVYLRELILPSKND
jgi:hypothetical protein